MDNHASRWIGLIDMSPYTFIRGLLIAIMIGLMLGTIFTLGLQVKSMNNPFNRCHEQVSAIPWMIAHDPSKVIDCPIGTYVHVATDNDKEYFVICSCEKPSMVFDHPRRRDEEDDVPISPKLFTIPVPLPPSQY
jgi:hypothetical protein